MPASPSDTRGSRLIAQVRALAAAAAATTGAYGLYQFQVVENEAKGWWLLAGALALAVGAQLGLRYPAPEPLPPPAAPTIRRRVLGAVVALAGAGLWGYATLRIYRNWQQGFDVAWMGWAGGAAIMGVGLDLAWGRWPRPLQRRWSWPVVGVMLMLFAVAAVYRLGNIKDYPGEAAITQIEDLQVGNFGWAYLHGYRLRWEYLSSTWLAALGIWLGGTSQFAMRVPFAAVSALKALPLFVWLRLMVGTGGAVVGTALLTYSFWDVVLSRIPNNHNALVVSVVFALLAGPVRRGRPSAYVLLGFFGGYVLHEYVAYRPLAAFAIAGAVLWSLRDHAAGWAARVTRPVLTVAVLLTMVTPLFLTRIPGPLRIEYFDGWNRAKGITGYYNPSDTWQQSMERRLARTEKAALLFTEHGDASPVRNVAGQPPLIDPVTCVLLVLGIGGAAANLLRPMFGLTLAGFLVTVAGTLVLTGNLDVARVGGAVPYVYALAGLGAAGVLSSFSQAWGRAGRWLAMALLTAAVAGAGWWCTQHLIELWTSPAIRRAHRNNLAYLTVWLRDHQRPGERVLGIAPGYANVLEMHDGGWLRGREIPGFVTWDVETALRQWQREPGPTLLFVFAGASTEAEADFLESWLPALKFQIDVDPLAAGADVAYARLPGPPPELADRLADWHCRGIHADFTIVGTSGAPLFESHTVAPFICKSTWPAAVVETLYRLTTRPAGIRIHYATPFTVTTPGEYRFDLETYAGTGTLQIDGQHSDDNGRTPVVLGAGLHQLVVDADFAPMAIEPVIRLLWSGPDSDGRQQLMPFYRLAPIDPSCAAAQGQAPFAGTDTHGRRYLTAWVGRGPFAGTGDEPIRHDFLDVGALSAAPDPTAAADWKPIEARDAFVDLDGAYDVEPSSPDAARSVCAYAATTIRAPEARAAALELAGSSDPVRVWLNGRELTTAPLTVGFEAKRRAIELRAGPNLLVIESCEELGAWYFIAAITDSHGADLTDLEYDAALPASPIPLAPLEPARDVQLVDGFAELAAAPHTQASYGDYRGGTRSWWAYVEDREPQVAWRTAPLAEARRTVVALTASTSPENASAELWVNGRSVLAFPVGTEGVGGAWQQQGYQAAFVSKRFTDGNSGIFLVSVPPEAVTPGQPLDLRVRLTGGAPRAWFMVKSYTDTVDYEHLSGPETQGQLSGVWESVRRANP